LAKLDEDGANNLRQGVMEFILTRTAEIEREPGAAEASELDSFAYVASHD
jgi:light-regulated signal transduction histidine kinase (bacteriophytochrome)